MAEVDLLSGNCWRSLPLEEKHVWEVKAKHAKAEHKLRYPEYRFRPVHNKNKEKKKEKPQVTPEEERRCEDVAALLLEGMKGEALAAAVRALDQKQKPYAHQVDRHRRSSSVPLPNDYYPQGIALPSVPFLSAHSRPASPARFMFGSRRASSAGARPVGNLSRAWTLPSIPLQRDNSALPEVDTSLFEQSFLDAAQGHYFSAAQDTASTMFANDILSASLMTRTDLPQLGPLDVTLSPHDMSSYAPSPATTLSVDWSQYDASPSSHGSSVYSGSPSPDLSSLPIHHLSLDNAGVPILSPQPVHPDINVHSDAVVFTDLWKGFTSGRSFSVDSQDATVKNSPQDDVYVYDASFGQYEMLDMI